MRLFLWKNHQMVLIFCICYQSFFKNVYGTTRTNSYLRLEGKRERVERMSFIPSSFWFVQLVRVSSFVRSAPLFELYSVTHT